MIEIKIDTHELVKKLRSSHGFSAEQAEGVVMVAIESLSSIAPELLSKADLNEATVEMDEKLSVLRNDISMIKPDIYKWILPLFVTFVGIVVSMFISMK